MQMTNEEIIKSYKQADKKQNQIRILAELNACTKDYIRQILTDAGCYVPKYGNRYTKKQTAKTDEAGFLQVPACVSDYVETEIRKLDRDMADYDAVIFEATEGKKRCQEAKAELLAFQKSIRKEIVKE